MNHDAAGPDPVMQSAVRLSVALDALAALAAHIRVEQESISTPPATRALLRDIAAEIVGDDASFDAAGGAVVGMARAFLRQAEELVDNPGRAGSWELVDPPLLDGLGRLSTAIVEAFDVATAHLDGLGDCLRSGGDVLDVGTGTGWLAIATARAFPDTRVVGIDVFTPALAIARRNVADCELTDRIELREQDACDLDADDRYDVVWLPLPFMPPDVVDRAIAAAARALRPGGWILAGTFVGSGDRLSELLVELRTVRSGGRVWTEAELIERFTQNGLDDAHELPRTWASPVRLFVARRPRAPR